MAYDSPAALRTALEQRLQSEAQATGIALNRLRRRVVFERIVFRIDVAEPGRWVVKGGMALEVRMPDRARTTKDLDLGLRDDSVDAAELRDRLIDALAAAPDGDGFTFAVGPATELGADEAGRSSLRFSVQASLAGKQFDGLKLDVAPREEELEPTERVTLTSRLSFAGIGARSVELIDVDRHAAEKVHAFTRAYGDRPSSRVRDVVDLVLLIENELLDIDRTIEALQTVFAQRATHLVDSITYHDLRHFFASVLIASGCSIKQVQMALGHDSARITLDTYAHLIPGDEDRVRDAIDRLPLALTADAARSPKLTTPSASRSGKISSR